MLTSILLIDRFSGFVFVSLLEDFIKKTNLKHGLVNS